MGRRAKFLISGFLVILALVATLPWWLGPVLRPILRARSITFERYEREGYTHFRLHNARFQRDRVTVAIQDLHAPTPALWLAQWLGAGPHLRAEHWSLHIEPAADDAPAGKPATVRGPPDLHALLHDRVWPRLVRWLPHAQLETGVLRGPHLDLTIEHVQFDRGTLRLDAIRQASHIFDLVATPAASGAFEFSGDIRDADVRLQFAWSGPDVNGGGTFRAQPLAYTAHFGPQGWLPATASATAEHWSLPAKDLKLGGPYVRVRGDARVDWRDESFAVSVNAAAEPEPNVQAPPFSIHAAAHGLPREFTLTQLDVNTPFATAKLSAPVSLSLDRPLGAQSAELTVQADLKNLPWLQAQGQVRGTFRMSGDATARQEFNLEAHDVVLPGFVLAQARVAGVIEGSRLEVTSLDAQLDAQSHVSAQGAVDWRERNVTAEVHGKFGASSLARWLPPGLTWTSADLSAKVEGPLDAPRHHGEIKFAGLRSSALKPVQLEGSWQGAGREVNAWSAQIHAGHSSIELAGSLDSQFLQLAKFRFSTAAGVVWELGSPARLAWGPVWRVDELALTGPASRLSLHGQGGEQSAIALGVEHFDSAWLEDWVQLPGPAWQVHTLKFAGQVAEGTLVFDATLDGTISAKQSAAQLHVVARGDAQGIEVKELTVADGARTMTRLTGRLPIAWQPGGSPGLHVDEAAPLEIAATTSPDSPLWSILAGFTALELTQPEARINVQGTLRKPAGDFELRVAKLAYKPRATGYSLPEAANLAVSVHFERSQVTLSNFSALLDGQALQASGKLPMSDRGWRQLWRQPAAFDWSEAEGQVEIPDADLAPFARHVPNFVAAMGRLHARVTLARGEKLSGELRVTNASTRPLPVLGPLQQINADFALEGRTVTIRQLAAVIGGEPVTLSGRATLEPNHPPKLSLALKGARLPLVRTDNLLVRADLDLHADTDAAGLTHLTGRALLRDSLALANFDSLLPTGVRSVTRVPPYFAVQADPYRAWPLAIDIRGPGALKIRTTVFSGTASASFHLGGTLGDPRAVGDLKVDTGNVLFPFATFKVQQGTVRLRQADPFHAQINVVALSQRRDYQLRLSVTGVLPSPVITFSSTPALDSSDVLLLVMTGQPPAESAGVSNSARAAALGAYLGRGMFDEIGMSGEDRLEVTSGEQVSRQGRETYGFEYKLGPRWSVEGEYDQFDSYNADLKYRVYVQESRPRENK